MTSNWLERNMFFSSLGFMFCMFWIQSFAEFPRFKHPPKHDGSLAVLVIGDWGRQGEHNQTLVANQMGIVGETLDIDYVISTGDNFYDNGLTSTNDPAFKQSFTDIYNATSLQKKWYTVLGNHDYRGDAEAQLDPVMRKIDSRWICLRSFVVNSEIAEFFFIDTSPFVTDYFTEPEHIYHWKGILPRDKYIANVKKDLKSALAKSTANWKIVIGHHPIRSAGHHGDTIDLIPAISPILRAHNVDMYINGHDHCLEHITSRYSAIQYLTSGGGSKAWRGDLRHITHPTVKFFYDGQGFLSLKVTQNTADVIFYDVFGNKIHEWRLSNQQASSMK